MYHSSQKYKKESFHLVCEQNNLTRQFSLMFFVAQLYVATCSPARNADASYVAWGHSTLVGPFGEVLATTEHDEAIVISEIDYSLIELRRTNLPLLKQKRGDLYQLVDLQRLKSE